MKTQRTVLDMDEINRQAKLFIYTATNNERVLWLQRNIPVLKAVSGLTLDVRKS